MSTENSKAGPGVADGSFAKHLEREHHKKINAAADNAANEDGASSPSLSSTLVAGDSSTHSQEEPVSEKVQGKRKEEPPTEAEKPKLSKKSVLNTDSEELFPTLGGGPAPRSSGPIAAAWSSKKPSSGINGGVNGAAVASKATSQQPASPVGMLSSQGGPPNAIKIPGRYEDQLKFAPSELLRKDQLRKPMNELVRDINKRSKANLEITHGLDGLVVFKAQGPAEDVRQALRDISRAVSVKVC